MISGLRIGGELRRFHRSTMGKVAIMAIIFIPLLYSALYLWAFWNPFNNLNQLPIALVNDDQGTVVDGERLDAGDQIVDRLQEQDQLSFTVVDEATAENGVKNGDFYFSVRLTPDFSESVASASEEKPSTAVIETNYNSSNGYLSTMIGENVMRTLVPTISNQLGAEVVDKLLVGLQDAGTGLDKAAVGADKLHNGAQELHTGLDKAGEGTNTLADKTGEAADGAEKLSTGAQELNSKTATLAQGADAVANGARTLDDGVGEAASQLNNLSNGVNQLHGGVQELGDGAAQIDTGVQDLNKKITAITAAQSDAADTLDNLAAEMRKSPIPQVRAAAKDVHYAANQARFEGIGPESQNAKDLKKLAEGTAQLSNQLNNPEAEFRGGFDQLHAGTSTLPESTKKLTDGTQKLREGSQSLADNTHKLHDEGTSTLADKSAQLADGLVKLNDGADALNEKLPTAIKGAKELSDGSSALSRKLSEGASTIPAMTAAQRHNKADIISNPASLDALDEAGTQTFGSGLAPFFFSLAMFIGGMITFLLLRPIQNRAVASGVSPLRAALDGLWPGAIIAILQSSIILAVTLWLVGLDAAHPFFLWLFCMGVSIMFVSINQMLNVALGPGPGKVLAMALLMLQILASGGLYPVETEPKIFQWLHPVDPMTYSINGFRQLIYGNLDHRVLQAVIAIGIITAISLAITTLCAYRDRTWTMKRLHPPVDV